MKKSRFFSKIIFLINSLLAIVTLLAYILPFIPPSWFPKLAILSFILPVLIVLHIAFVIFWLLQWRRQFLLSTFILIIGIGSIHCMYRFGGDPASTTQPDDLKILTYNVKSFNHKKWINEDGLDQKIIQFITSSGADIVCLQEYRSDYQLSKGQYPYQYQKLTNTKYKFGHTIYSKYPIVNSGSFDFEQSGNNILYVDVKVDQDTVRVYNAHLQSFGVSTDFEDIQEHSDRFMRRIGNAVVKQESQVQQFIDHEAQSPYPVIVAGDFNNSAFSYTYRKMKGNKQDAFVQAGSGIGKTFDFDFMPLRIDFIMPDDQFQVNSFMNYTVKYSDHYPVMTSLKLLEK